MIFYTKKGINPRKFTKYKCTLFFFILWINKRQRKPKGQQEWTIK
jgi:hypothetical protein